MAFDPTASLPGAPDPWAGSDIPAWRDAPPYAMTEMVAAEPALAGRLVRRLQADPVVARVATAIREAADGGRASTTSGCGTSQHAAIGLAALLTDGLAAVGVTTPTVEAIQAFELAGRPRTEGVLLAVSHEGGTEATNLALERHGGRDGATALITVSDRSPGAARARDVLTTDEQDQSWCHTVGYLSPLVAGACLRATLTSTPLDPDAVAAQVGAGSDESTAEALAAGLAGIDRLVAVGSGADYAAARELALKVEEGVHLPAVAHELETIRHGHYAAMSERTGLVVFLADGERRGTEVRDRAASVLRGAAALGMPSVVIGSADQVEVANGASLGHLLVELDPRLDRLTAAVLGVVVPLQLLTERLARVRGTNPDTIGRDDPRHAAAGSA